MPDLHDFDEFLAVVNFINNPQGSDPDPPVMLGAGDFASAMRSRIVREGLDSANNSVKILGGKALEVSLRCSLQPDFITRASIAQGTCPIF